eukprot:1600665-Amphidinium_carterae.1
MVTDTAQNVTLGNSLAIEAHSFSYDFMSRPCVQIDGGKRTNLTSLSTNDCMATELPRATCLEVEPATHCDNYCAHLLFGWTLQICNTESQPEHKRQRVSCVSKFERIEVPTVATLQGPEKLPWSSGQEAWRPLELQHRSVAHHSKA